MVASITFDTTKFTSRLNLLQQSVSKAAGTTALKGLGYTLTKEELPKAVKGQKGKYGGYRDPVSFTQRAFFYSVNKDVLQIRVNDNAPKGNAPAKYLFPVTQNPGSGERLGQSRSTILPTKFAGYLRQKGYISGSTYPSPNLNSPLLKKTPQKNIRPTDYRQVIFGLSRTISASTEKTKKYNAGFARQNIFSIGMEQKGGKVTPGIYRAKTKNSLEMLFKYLPSPPAVPISFAYEDFLRDRAAALFFKKYKKAIGMRIDRL